jgi:hypothetical protein
MTAVMRPTLLRTLCLPIALNGELRVRSRVKLARGTPGGHGDKSAPSRSLQSRKTRVDTLIA